MSRLVARYALLACALATVTAIAACGSDKANGKTVTEDANGRTVTLHGGEQLTLKLTENQSTGYTWRITGRPSPSVLRLTSSRFVPPDTNPPRAGASGTHVYRFTAAGSGSTSIRLDQYPPSAGARSFKSFRMTVDVR